MKFTYNGMDIECTVEEFMKIAGCGGEEAKDPVEVIGKLTDPVSLSLDPVELDKETIGKLLGVDVEHTPCSSCCLCKVYSDPDCEDEDENLCPNYYEAGCAYRNGVLDKDLTEKLIFGEDENNGVLDKLKERDALIAEFKKEPGYLEKEKPWPYHEAKVTLESIMETAYLLTIVDITIKKTDNPGYEPGGVVVICPKVDDAYQVYDDAGYVMPVDDLVGFVRTAYHSDISIYSPLELVDEDFAKEVEDACRIIAMEDIKKSLKQR